jgi:hypothetical protein
LDIPEIFVYFLDYLPFNFPHNGGANMPDYDCILPAQTTNLVWMGEGWYAKGVCKCGQP